MEFKGELQGFPVEVVEKMLERQVEQGNKRDLSVFEKSIYFYKNIGGFNWDETIEGTSFWDKVLRVKNFHHFFEKYPKGENTQQEFYQ